MGGLMGGGKTAQQPARRPDRVAEIEPEDIELGTSDQTEGVDLRTNGKRSLTKPSGASVGLKI